MRKETVTIIEYSELEDLIKKHTNLYFDIVNEMGLNNDSLCWYIGHYLTDDEVKSIENDINNGLCTIYEAIDMLIYKKIITDNVFLIEVCW